MLDTLKTKLLELGLTEDQIQKLEVEGVQEEADMSNLNSEELKSITGAGLVLCKKIVAEFAPKVEAPTVTSFTGTELSILPAVPSDESWLEALKIGGVLKVDKNSVVSAIKAALADKVSLFSLTEKIAQKMEAFADENAEPVPVEFFSIMKDLTRKTYADIFAAIDGLDGSFVTKKRKDMFLQKIEKYFWPELSSFFGSLKSWIEVWQQGANNPAVMMQTIMSISSGVKVPSMMLNTQPDGGIIRDGADALNDSINKVFGGMGGQIAAALAYDALRVKNILEKGDLPAMVGATNKDQMLKMLGVNVPATYPRLEMSLTRFVLGVLNIKNVTAEEELQYFSQLYMLGSSITWDKLGNLDNFGNRPL